MRFEISHEFDATLDALELAIMSPELGSRMSSEWDSIESVDTVSHELSDDQFERVWRFQAKAPLKVLEGYDVTREMMAWHEHSNYQLRDHTAKWHIVPCDPNARWRDYFTARGTYQLDPLADGRTRRTIVGHLDIHVKMLGSVLARVALAEVRKAYDAEAAALRALCEL